MKKAFCFFLPLSNQPQTAVTTITNVWFAQLFDASKYCRCTSLNLQLSRVRVPRGDEWNIEKHFTGDVTFLHFIWLVLCNKFDSETTLRQALFPIVLYFSLTHRHTHWMWILEFEFPNAKKKVHICVCIHMHIVILVAPETEQISFLKNTQKICYFLKSLFAYSSLSLSLPFSCLYIPEISSDCKSHLDFFASLSLCLHFFI